MSDLLDHTVVDTVDDHESDRPTAHIRAYGNASFFIALQQSNEWTHGNISVRGDSTPTTDTRLAVNLKRYR